jgi:hydroxycarboxylate dehydrogenase B
VADRLAEANLLGHDSHGVLRVPIYLADLKAGDVAIGQRPQLISESIAGAYFDGRRGLGQVAGEIVVDYGATKARATGTATVTLRNVGHLGRLGRWAERAAALGLVSLHFVNTSGGAPANVMLVAPFGGRTRRMSVNPMCIGMPRLPEPPIVMDATIAATAGGKVMAARNRGERLPPGQIIDRDGCPTTEPEALFTGGAILPFGDHRGYALSFMIDVLAGALTGGGCSPQEQHPKMNNMTSIFIDPVHVGGTHFDRDLSFYAEWIKASPPIQPDGEVLLPGEVELRTARKRRAEGIPLDATTLRQLNEAAACFGLPPLTL